MIRILTYDIKIEEMSKHGEWKLKKDRMESEVP
jgi:hypothetical protein